MTKKTWLITGVSSGFGRAMTAQLLAAGNTVIGTVRNTAKVQDLIDQYPDTFICEILDVMDVPAIHELVNRVATEHSIDVLVNNAGYGLFGAAEELSDADIDKILATDLTGSIQMIRSVLPFMRKQQHGQIIQISSYGGQVAFAGNSMYHAAKFGIEGFCESVAQEVEPFNIGMTIVEPGGARTEFRYGSAHVANLMKEYDENPAHAFMKMLDPANGLAPGDPARMAARIIESVDQPDTPLHMVLGSQALASTIATIEKRLAEYQTEKELAASTDFPAGE
ncbi:MULTISPECIES: SDR family oxidoreductase [Lactiplantibacillus]|jgi:NAD(P)-dependent dehydrogenase (short-subunit alcohol dehydrogenase family)|uniref:Short chain dehydrogenase n=1 Tax=Lactiplantibacillus pentosus IG1 TaxID=1042160 RepID=G0M5J1_LACPE|nr:MULTISPECIES: SDR family oxidoreductase [Lactiplantibacillus]CCC17523.1 short chain dehydrogenase [Lactiplantibacillus pentosus IG1]ASG80269.1 short-chain dehydrogenase/reductase [Lactiplantibacillus pentosus]MBO9164866.1 SDR family oxidoreductase [Lactiplantibacillus pentosus]MBU7449150.1 SDR family oxidoreductase [Lactiplantibacillus sp. 7.2.4]MBU7481541.1 SDR family oxidoreductase [Lactiplantibacillus pentosus]